VSTVLRHLTTLALRPAPAVLIAWVVVFAIHAAVGLSFSKVPGHGIVILFDAGLTAAAIAVLVSLILTVSRHAHRQQESNAAEVNHQIRNALQLIVNAEYRAEDTNRRGLIMESVARIDRTLRTLFPLHRP
jgi:hypothetical protein